MLTDFGLSKEISSSSERSYTICGTTEYMAPEIFAPREGHGRAVDWWALGVLTFEFLCGYTPFRGPQNVSSEEIKDNIRSGRFLFPGSVPITIECRQFIQALLRVDENTRLGSARDVDEVLVSTWELFS